jgi:mRNA interferase MazF
MQQYDIILVDLNPIKGSEQSGIRPCIVLQNNYANSVSRTFVVAILSTVIKRYPHTLIVNPSPLNGLEQTSRIDCLQVRTIDTERIIHKIGSLDPRDHSRLASTLKVAFAME